MENALGEYQNIVLLGGRSEIGTAIAQRVATSFTQKIVLAGRNLSADDVESFRSGLSQRDLSSIDVSTRDFDAIDFQNHHNFMDDLGLDSIDLVIIAFGQLGDHDELRKDPRRAADLVSVNMTGTISVGLAVASAMEKQGHGQIIFLSSVAAVRTRRSNFIYGASKAGMDAFAQGLGDALVGTGVGVTIVRPGFVRTAMTRGMDPAPFATDSAHVAERVAEGLRRGRRVIWAPGILQYVFTILRNLPTPIWRRLPIN